MVHFAECIFRVIVIKPMHNLFLCAFHILRIVEYDHLFMFQVSHIFKSYGPGVRYIHFLHKSKDLSVLGFHRTRVADSTLFVQLKECSKTGE